MTGYGKELLSRGDLNFVYWSSFDDEVDYDPILYDEKVTGSTTFISNDIDSFRQMSIEDTLVREATTGYKKFNRSGSDNTNVIRPMFDIPQGQKVLPRFINNPSDISIEIKQNKISELLIKRDQNGNVIEQMGPYDRGYKKYDSTKKMFEFNFNDGAFPPDYKAQGFLVRMYQSSSDGLIEIGQKIDANNTISFSNDLILYPPNEGK